MQLRSWFPLPEKPAPRSPLAGGLLVVLERTAVNPRPLVCRCCSEERHLLASIKLPPEGCSSQGADAKPSLVRHKGLRKEPWFHDNMRCSIPAGLDAFLGAFRLKGLQARSHAL